MKLLEVLKDIRNEIDQCYFALCFELDSSLLLGISTAKYESAADSIATAFGQILNIITDGQKNARNETVRNVLTTFKELILETTQSTFFIMVPNKNDKIAVAIGVPAEIKLGYAKLIINNHSTRLIESINEII